MKKYSEKSHTFVVCAYKESQFLEACISSLMKQTVKTKILIATSTPNQTIDELAQKYGLTVKVNAGEGGIANDWNFACTCADTPLVTLAHQDDVYLETYTEQILAALNQCEHPLIAFTDYYELRTEGIVRQNLLLRIKRLLLFPLKYKFFWKNKWIRRRILSLGSAICCPSVTLVKEHLQLPLFENNMKSNIDWQAWEMLSRKDGEFAYVNKPSMLHRIHETSTTSELLSVNGRREEDLVMYRKFWPSWMANLIEVFYKKSEKSNHSVKRETM